MLSACNKGSFLIYLGKYLHILFHTFTGPQVQTISRSLLLSEMQVRRTCRILLLALKTVKKNMNGINSLLAGRARKGGQGNLHPLWFFNNLPKVVFAFQNE